MTQFWNATFSLNLILPVTSELKIRSMFRSISFIISNILREN